MTENKLVNAREKMGAPLFYTFWFAYSYTAFSIFFTSYVWVLNKVLGFRIVGSLFWVF